MDEQTLKELEAIQNLTFDVTAGVIALKHVLVNAGLVEPQSFQDLLMKIRLAISDHPANERQKMASHSIVFD